MHIIVPCLVSGSNCQPPPLKRTTNRSYKCSITCCQLPRHSTVNYLQQWPICIIRSRDYCHAPLGVSSFSFSIQNVWEMTTVVYKIACHSCTACPPVLRLSIADSISSATVYSQCVKALHTRQKHGEFYWHDCKTASRPNKN